MSARQSKANTRFADLPAAEHARWALIFLVATVLVSVVLVAFVGPLAALAVSFVGSGAVFGIVFRLYRRLP